MTVVSTPGTHYYQPDELSPEVEKGVQFGPDSVLNFTKHELDGDLFLGIVERVFMDSQRFKGEKGRDGRCRVWCGGRAWELYGGNERKRADSLQYDPLPPQPH